MTLRVAVLRSGGAIGLFIGAIVLSLVLARHPSPLAASDAWVEGVAYRFLAPNRPTSDRIVIIGITEETLAILPNRSPIDRRFLADLIDALVARQVRAIGLDILLDRPSEGDAQLISAIARAPVVLASAGPDTPLLEQQRRELEAFLAEGHHGQANLARDVFDNTVRSYIPIDDKGEPNFAAAIAQTAGVTPPREPFRIFWRRNETGRPFPIYPAQLVKVLPPEWLRDKIVLIGAMIPGEDEHRTPLSIFATPMHGVEIHAHALSQMLERRVQRPPDWLDAAGIALAAAAGMGLAAATSGTVFFVGLVSLAMLILATVIAIFALLSGPLILPLAPILSLGLGAGGTRFWVGRNERRERQILRQLFSRFVSEPVVRELWKERETYLKEGGRPRPIQLTATVLFSDIAGFTTHTEGLPPEPLYTWLNEYIDAMVEVVSAHDGIVLRFIGDGVLAVFGVPIVRQSEAEIDTDARHAVLAAKTMVSAVRRLNVVWQSRGLPVAAIRIGIYTGPLLAGSVGSGSHMEYIVQGDTVNTAARLEALGKNYLGADNECIILVGEPTYARLNGCVSLVKVGDVKLKGKQITTTIYQVVFE